MDTIAIIAEKGGVGKTSIALNLAVAAVYHKRTAAVVDIDPQSTASKWTDRRTEELPWVVPTHSVRLPATIKQAQAQGVDFLVIDTPPHSGTDAVEAARRADLVLVPVEPHVFTLETLPKLADLFKLAGNVPSLFVVNKAATQGTEGKNAAEYIKAQGFTVCPVILSLRAAHRHATNVGKVAAEFEPKGKAAEEIIQLYRYTAKLVNSLKGELNAKTESAHARA